MQTDTFLKIGKSHQVCEDYILSANKPFNYIILSDGCSTSKNTDMGARLLCHLAKQYILYRRADTYSMFPELDYEIMGAWIIHNAELTARQLGLNQSCLNATLIIAYEFEDKYRIYMYGDGSIILQNEHDEIKYIQVDFSENAPYYLTYRISPENLKEYHKLGQDVIITDQKTNQAMIQDIYAYDAKLYFEFSSLKYSKMLICSDGISSFQKDSDRINDIIPIAKEFLSYKSTKGEFLKRRLKRAIKIYEAEGMHHMDDLSVGAFLQED